MSCERQSTYNAIQICMCVLYYCSFFTAAATGTPVLNSSPFNQIHHIMIIAYDMCFDCICSSVFNFFFVVPFFPYSILFNSIQKIIFHRYSVSMADTCLTNCSVKCIALDAWFCMPCIFSWAHTGNNLLFAFSFFVCCCCYIVRLFSLLLI